MARKLLVILVVVMIFCVTEVLASEREAPRAREVVYSSDFLPPHVEAKFELERIQDEWRDQELATLISKREKTDEE